MSILHSLHKQFYITWQSFTEGFSCFKYLLQKKKGKNPEDFPNTHTFTATVGNDPLSGLTEAVVLLLIGDFLLAAVSNQSAESKGVTTGWNDVSQPIVVRLRVGYHVNRQLIFKEK